jgi:hypothetical protein
MAMQQLRGSGAGQMSEREDWINLVHNEYHPRPSFYSGFEWNDGTGRIADAILADKVLALREAADRIAALEAALRETRGALAWIHNSTEADAVKHRSYDELAAGIYDIAKAALDGEFVDDMHAAEIYDKLYPRAALAPEQDK